MPRDLASMHPAWCAPAHCRSSAGGDLQHASDPAFVPLGRDGEVFAVTRYRGDETYADGTQLIHGVEVLVHNAAGTLVFHAPADVARDLGAALTEAARPAGETPTKTT